MESTSIVKTTLFDEAQAIRYNQFQEYLKNHMLMGSAFLNLYRIIKLNETGFDGKKPLISLSSGKTFPTQREKKLRIIRQHLETVDKEKQYPFNQSDWWIQNYDSSHVEDPNACLYKVEEEGRICIDVLDKFMIICNRLQVMLMYDNSYPLHRPNNKAKTALYCFPASLYTSLQNFISTTSPTAKIPSVLVPSSIHYHYQQSDADRPAVATFDIFHFRKWLFPINIKGDHYIAIVFDFENEIITIYDSYKSYGEMDANAKLYSEVVLTIIGWCKEFLLKRVYADKNYESLFQSFIDHLCLDMFPATPQQDGIHDCGLAVSCLAYHIIHDIPIIYDSATIKNFRKFMCYVLLPNISENDLPANLKSTNKNTSSLEEANHNTIDDKVASSKGDKSVSFEQDKEEGGKESESDNEEEDLQEGGETKPKEEGGKESESDNEEEDLQEGGETHTKDKVEDLKKIMEAGDNCDDCDFSLVVVGADLLVSCKEVKEND